MPITGTYWSAEELSERVGCDASHVRLLCIRERLKCVKYGSIWLIPDDQAQILIGRKKGERWEDGQGDTDISSCPVVDRSVEGGQ